MQISLGKILSILTMFSLYLNAYDFSANLNNKHPMLGEKIDLTLSFSYKNLEEYEIQEPNFEGFEIKLKKDDEKKSEDGTFKVTQIYELIPQKAGNFTFAPLKTHIEMIEEKDQERYNKNRYLKKFDIFTKPLTMQVLALPKGLKVTGDYNLIANIDKNHTKLGEPIHFRVKLKGEGNIQNLNFLTMQIANTTIYETSISAYEKSFDIIGESDFTIPPMLLQYYNQKTKQITLTNTKPFHIKVEGDKKTKEQFKIFWWLLLLLPPLFWIVLKRFKKDTWHKQLKRCKNKEMLLKKLIPYLEKNRQLTRLIYKLEDCKKEDFKMIKKDILKHF